MNILEIKCCLISVYGQSIYLDRYIKLIECAIEEKFINYDYYELHHILPRSLFEEYVRCKWNIIKVPGKLHYILHYLLAKFTNDVKMIHAFNNMRRIQSTLVPNCRLYEAFRDIWVQNQKKRRYYFNTKTGKKKFVFEKPDGDCWVLGYGSWNGPSRKGQKYWAHDPTSLECTSFSVGMPMPEGWVRGRLIKDNPFDDLNNKKRFFNLITKQYEYVKVKEKHHCSKNNYKLKEDSILYIYNNKITLSLFQICLCIGVDYYSYNFDNMLEFVVPLPHFKMKPKWKEFCEKNSGKTFGSVGLEIVKISDFIYVDGMEGV